jgi:hypothetical protein
MGKTVCQTNDPVIGQIAFTESEFFSKEINDDHPLKPIKQEAAGVFVSDTSNPYVHTHPISVESVEETARMLTRCPTERTSPPGPSNQSLNNH